MNHQHVKTLTKEILVPFTGFYQTIHGDFIDNKGLSKKDLVVDYKRFFKDYADKYVYLAAREAGIPLEFSEVSSPREYNFTTDLVVALIRAADIADLYKKAIQTGELEGVVRELFTSRAGFASYYPNNIEEWGSVHTWDRVQLGALLEVLIDKGSLVVSWGVKLHPTLELKNE